MCTMNTKHHFNSLMDKLHLVSFEGERIAWNWNEAANTHNDELFNNGILICLFMLCVSSTRLRASLIDDNHLEREVFV